MTYHTAYWSYHSVSGLKQSRFKSNSSEVIPLQICRQTHFITHGRLESFLTCDAYGLSCEEDLKIFSIIMLMASPVRRTSKYLVLSCLWPLLWEGFKIFSITMLMASHVRGPQNILYCHSMAHMNLRNQGSGDSLVIRLLDLWLKSRWFESWQEGWENFFLQGQLSVLTLILVSVQPWCYHNST